MDNLLKKVLKQQEKIKKASEKLKELQDSCAHDNIIVIKKTTSSPFEYVIYESVTSQCTNCLKLWTVCK